MPCESGPTDVQCVQEELDEVTAMLCDTLSRLTDSQLKIKTSLDTQVWWKKHQKQDKKRLKKELAEQKEKQAIDKAKKKLTPKERELLGL